MYYIDLAVLPPGERWVMSLLVAVNKEVCQ